jgi:hypothetical protein
VISSARVRAVTAAMAILGAGCQSSGGEDIPPPSGGPVGGAAGGRTDGGSSAGAGELRISVVAPKAMDVLKAGTSSEVRVRVTSVRPGTNDPSGDPVDPSSIVASLRRTTDNGEATHGPLFGPMPNSEFAAPIDLSNVNTGDYQLIVTAATSGGTKGMAVSPVRVDAGPRIEINSPKENGSYKDSLTIQVLIDSAPFGPTMNVEASIGAQSITLNQTGAPNTYEALVELLGLAAPLQGEQVFKVSATNVAGTRTEARVRFTIDNKGPEITETEPKEGSVVGGILRIRARVNDQSGVLGNSVVAIIGNRQDVNFKVELKPEAETGLYSGLFDSARLTACKPAPDSSLCIVFPNLSFRASDRAGNESSVAYDIGVDNHPPVADLTPPGNLRIVRYDTEQKRLVCSWPFNPIGEYEKIGDMPRDLCAVPQVFDMRARIEDFGNRADGLKFAPVSGVDPATTALYVLADTSQPLVVDVDGDGVCDAINPKLIPTTKGPTQSNEVLTVRFAPVPPKGSADFTPDPSLTTPAGGLTSPPCNPGRSPTGPRRLCGAQPQNVVIGYPAAVGPSPSIWAIEPITANEPWCVGSQFDTYANKIPEGWACFAAAATDKLGSTGVSNPLRVWISYKWPVGELPAGGPTCPPAPPRAGGAPNCTGSFNRQTGVVTSTPCVGRSYKFAAPELLDQGALPEGM